MGKILSHEEKTEKARELVLQFLTNVIGGSSLDEQLGKLKKYSFWGISGKTEYDGTTDSHYSEEFDGDRTKIVYAVDYLLYSVKLEKNDFSIPGYQWKTEFNYSGDTINTFNTLFYKDKTKRENLLRVFGSDAAIIYNPQEIQSDNSYAEDFYHVYQRLGNFMLLPTKTLESRRSLNSYRGLHSAWKDYFSPFMECLKASFEQNSTYKDSESLENIKKLKEKNSFYFTKGKALNDFIKDFYLTHYELLTLKDYFRGSDINENNKDISLEYVNNAVSFINARTDILVEELRNKLAGKA